MLLRTNSLRVSNHLLNLLYVSWMRFKTCVWHVVMDCKVFCMGKYCVMQHHVWVSWLNKDLDMDCKVLFGFFFHVYTGDISIFNAHVNVKFWFSMLLASLKVWFKSSDLLEQLAAGVNNQASNVFATLIFLCLSYFKV